MLSYSKGQTYRKVEAQSCGSHEDSRAAEDERIVCQEQRKTLGEMLSLRLFSILNYLLSQRKELGCGRVLPPASAGDSAWESSPNLLSGSPAIAPKVRFSSAAKPPVWVRGMASPTSAYTELPGPVKEVRC
jgi:hypothetical protein